MRKLFSLMLVAIVACGITSCDMYDSIFPQEEGAWLVDGPTFNELIIDNFGGSDITAIEFQANCSETMPQKAVDVSDDEDESAWAIKEGKTLYIRTQKSTFTANADCSGMFSFQGYDIYIKNIKFNNVFNTKNVTNMSMMFGGNENLKSLDLTCFDTSNVTDMSMMFGYNYLTLLNLSSFNTKNVKNFQLTFNNNNPVMIILGDGFVFNSQLQKEDCLLMFNCEAFIPTLVSCPEATLKQINEWGLLDPGF